MKVLCIGQAAYDITLPMDHYPIENKKVRVMDRIECGGGSASNCAYLLAKWGMNVSFAGVVGNDYYGDRIKAELDEGGVNTEYLQKLGNVRTTASYIIANTSVGTRTILTNRDKQLKMFSVDIKDDFDLILLDGYERDIAIKAINSNPHAIKILDAGSMKESTVELAHMVDYLVCSNDFAQEYTGISIDYDNQETINRIYDKIKEDFKNNVIITLEHHGSFTKIGDNYVLVPSIKMKAIDTTGAGDIYHGAFTYCVANNYELSKTLRIANLSGALSVTKIGSRFSIPTYEEVISKYNEHII